MYFFGTDIKKDLYGTNCDGNRNKNKNDYDKLLTKPHKSNLLIFVYNLKFLNSYIKIFNKMIFHVFVFPTIRPHFGRRT